MDLRTWRMDQILMLPDWCFGRRWTIMAHRYVQGPGSAWRISSEAFPERCVMWSLELYPQECTDYNCWIRLALGHHVPTTIAQMNALDPLVPGFGTDGPEPREIRLYFSVGHSHLTMRNPLMTGGRRLVLEVTTTGGNEMRAWAAVEISSIPNEVPDELVGAAFAPFRSFARRRVESVPGTEIKKPIEGKVK